MAPNLWTYAGLLIAISAIADTNPVPENLLSNGGFEEGVYSPTGWQTEAWLPTADFHWDDAVARSGDKSVKITALTENDARWIQTLSVEPSQPYFLSGWIKTENVSHTSGSVVAGANLSLVGTWQHSRGVFGNQDWTRNSLLFNPADDNTATVGARLGYAAGTTTGTAWFDDLRLEKLVPMDPHPAWKILVLIYRDTDFEVVDEEGIYHRYVASLTDNELQQAIDAARQFIEVDIPALTSGNMVPEGTIRVPDHALSSLTPIGTGYWPSFADTAPDGGPEFDSVIVFWDTMATDVTTGEEVIIGWQGGLSANRGTQQTYLTIQSTYRFPISSTNVFKHEWGHSILYFYDSLGTAPKPTVTNHAHATQYVNCETGQFYVWEDETADNPIPNSIYNNDSGFTHDYYSGKTALAEEPTRCLGISPEAWAFGGPVSHWGNRERAPRFTSVPATDAMQGAPYSYSVTAEDPELDAITITASVKPDWLILVDNGDGTAELSGVPGNADVGDNSVQLVASDPHGLTDEQVFTIAVANVNDAPEFTSVPVTEATEASAYSYTITIQDPDSDAVMITAPTVPLWLTFTDIGNGTATLTGAPTGAEVGDHTVELQARETPPAPGLAATQSFVITVTAAPEGPVIALVGDATVTLIEGSDFNDPGATASDLQDGDLTDYIIVDSPVNVDVPATYTVTYSVEDSAGHTAQAQRTVIVEAAPIAQRRWGSGGGSAGVRELLALLILAVSGNLVGRRRASF